MLDPVEEAKFAAMREACRELKVPPPPELFIGIKIHDKDGNLIVDDIQRGHSWTRCYYNYLCYGFANQNMGAAVYGAGYISLKKPDGTVYGSGQESSMGIARIGGAVSNSTYGIQVGTGDTPFNVDQFVLAALISHGSTAGTLFYQAASTNVCTYSGKVWSTILSRVFNNNSGATIIVKESGLVVSASSGWTFLIERSVLSPPYAVPNGAQLTVSYTTSMDFSAID